MIGSSVFTMKPNGDVPTFVRLLFCPTGVIATGMEVDPDFLPSGEEVEGMASAFNDDEDSQKGPHNKGGQGHLWAATPAIREASFSSDSLK